MKPQMRHIYFFTTPTGAKAFFARKRSTSPKRSLAPTPRRERSREPVEPLIRIRELEQRLLEPERDGQQLDEPAANPRRVVETGLGAAIKRQRLHEPPQQLGERRMHRRQPLGGRRGEPLHLADVQA